MIAIGPGAPAAAPTHSAVVGFKLINGSLTRQFDAFERSAPVRREVEHVRKALGSVDSAEDLVGDYRVYRFVLSAFGLDAQIGAKAFMKKVLAEDWRDPKSMAANLVDPRFREIAKAFDFARSGGAKLESAAFVDGLVDRYLTAEFEKKAGETNPALRHALYFKRMAPQLQNWFQVLGDKPLFEVVRTALGIPGLGSQVDIDKQAAQLEKRIGLANFKNARFVEQFVNRFLAAYDAKSPAAPSAVASLVQPLSGGGTPTLSASTLLSLATQR